ncbi:hypothetical protein ACFX11_012988 [Malus domestica]
MEALTKNELTVAVGFVIFTVVISGVGAWTGEIHGRVDVCGDSVVEPEDHVLEGAEWHRRCPRVIGGMHAWCDLSTTSMSTAAILGVVAQALSSLIITPMSFLSSAVSLLEFQGSLASPDLFFTFFIMTVTLVGFIAKTGFTVYSYFDSWSQIRLKCFLGRLSSFVLFWTVAYDIVHIF